MDGKDLKASLSPAWAQGALLALVLGLGALFVKDEPFSSYRMPDDPTRIDQHFGAQDVDARMWQDPIGVVAARPRRGSGGIATACGARPGWRDRQTFRGRWRRCGRRHDAWRPAHRIGGTPQARALRGARRRERDVVRARRFGTSGLDRTSHGKRRGAGLA